ncbi:MAG: hypothetical protein K0Q72_59, partial [Armatimonadetes bacterium]|nr:hypothetical protein [Armatimonadota bacterium]
MLDTNRHQTPTRLAAALLLPLLGVGLAQAQASVATGRQGTLSPARPGKAALPL